MKLGLTDVDWGYVGAVLARGGDDEQAEFFKAFVKECRSWGTEYQVQTQLAAINNKLTGEEKRALAMLSYSEGEQ